MERKPLKQKKCRSCKDLFHPISSTQIVCSPKCAIALSGLAKEKKKRKTDREHRVKLRTRSEWLKLAQAAFNAFIRERDRNDPCISCGRHHQGQYHAGHYLSVGARPELRFEEIQVNKQCAPCNNHLSGNIALYRINLIKKIGLDKVEWIEGAHDPKKYSIDELIEIRRLYLEKAKELKR